MNKHIEPMLELYIYEINQFIDNLEHIVLSTDYDNGFGISDIDEIFRILHSIKGVSSMMLYDNIVSLVHAEEDIFYYMRNGRIKEYDTKELTDIILESCDFIKVELIKIEQYQPVDGNASNIIEKAKSFLGNSKEFNSYDYKENEKSQRKSLPAHFYIASKNKTTKYESTYQITVFFKESRGLENIRAYILINSLEKLSIEIKHYPANLMEDDSVAKDIYEHGFIINTRTNSEVSIEEIKKKLDEFPHISTYDLIELDEKEYKEQTQNIDDSKTINKNITNRVTKTERLNTTKHRTYSNLTSVNVDNLNILIYLVEKLGESDSKISEEIKHMDIISKDYKKLLFNQHKIILELQEITLSLTKVSFYQLFKKMKRLIHDMSRKLEKEIDLITIGNDVVVKKNLLEQLSDPLMHLIRNACDHGIENTKERIIKGKNKRGIINMEVTADNENLILVLSDDGRGLNIEKIRAKIMQNNLIGENIEISDCDLYQNIFATGFTTKDEADEFSGRGVGLDIVINNIKKINGTVKVESENDKGTKFTINIPLL